MNCKVCNTRLSRTATNCPNCGNAAGPGSSGREDSRSDTMPLPDARRLADPEEEAEAALAQAGIGSTPRKKKGPRTAPAPPPRAESDPAAPGPLELRELLAQRPESLDAGLSVHTDERGVPSGVGFSTAVGEIDLLARDGSGAYVVILVADHEGAEELVAAVLQRMGWVRKHLAKGTGSVRGIVLVDREPDSLSYAAAAVADTVAFMTYRLALTFEPVEL